MQKFQTLDSANGPIPEFVAKNLDRVPKYGPEELDLVSLVERVNRLEMDRNLIEKKVAKNTDSVETLFAIHHRTNSFAAKVVSPGLSTGNDGAQTVSNSEQGGSVFSMLGGS